MSIDSFTQLYHLCRRELEHENGADPPAGHRVAPIRDYMTQLGVSLEDALRITADGSDGGDHGILLLGLLQHCAERLRDEFPPGWKPGPCGDYPELPVRTLAEMSAWLDREIPRIDGREDVETRAARDETRVAFDNAVRAAESIGLACRSELRLRPNAAAGMLHRLKNMRDSIRRDARSAMPTGNVVTKLGVEAKALALSFEHPDWTNAQIANAIGTNPKYLSQLPKFKNARAAMKEAGKQSIPRGTKRDRVIEAQSVPVAADDEPTCECGSTRIYISRRCRDCYERSVRNSVNRDARRHS